MFERKEALLKKFFNSNDNAFFLSFRRFYGFLHLLKVYFFNFEDFEEKKLKFYNIRKPKSMN